MTEANHYDTLRISCKASPAEIKQAYRHLVKLFHPDSKCDTADHEQIIRINAAYEVLRDPQQRQSYDHQLLQRRHHSERGNRQQRPTAAQNRYRQPQPTGQDADEHLHQWMQHVYVPINRLLSRILNPLVTQLDQLSADPFDDQLMEAFQAYLQDCRYYLNQAQQAFRSQPNPAYVAGAAADLYHCLNQLGDGIEELERFTLNYDEHYIHTGQELFRIAAVLRRQAQISLKHIAY